MNEKISERTKNISSIVWRIFMSLYALFVLAIHFIRIFDENFWGDEAFTVNTIRADFFEMINITAADVHPPLYYIIIKAFSELFGYNGVVYHIASFVPYALIIIIGLTVIWKWFGKETSLIFITFCSFLNCSIDMAAEVRMYTWAALFVLISFLAFYKILTENKKEHWIIFVVASLAAAYTHYYCIVSVAFFYIILMLDALIRNRCNIKKACITYAVTILGYLPWLFILLETFKRTIGNFWQTGVVGSYPFLIYIFEGEYTIQLYYLFLIVFALWVIFEIGIISYDEEEKKIKFFDYKNFKITDRLIWVSTSVIAMFGTIAVGIWVSNNIRPMFIPRYIFPIAITIWLVFGICISKFRFKTIYAIALTAVVLSTGLPLYYTKYTNEKASNDLHVYTYDSICSEMGEGDGIVTNDYYLNWTVLECYFPDTVFMPSPEFVDKYDPDMTYWFIWTEPFDEEWQNEIKSYGYEIEPFIDNGVIGTYPVSVYKVTPVE